MTEEFVHQEIITAVSTFINSKNTSSFSNAADIIVESFGFGGESFSKNIKNDNSLVSSFRNNLKLLIQKTWVEKNDINIKEQVLYQLEQFNQDNFTSWKDSYPMFLEILYSAVYLMFGQQVQEEDFTEYAFRIDPEFGVFWLYIGNLPRECDWSEEKYRLAIQVGMYFLANY